MELSPGRKRKIYEYSSGNKRAFIIYYCQIMKATMMIVALFAIIKEFESTVHIHDMITIKKVKISLKPYKYPFLV